ncbi:unnamed protein product, partial [Parascedosporium putredinis]
LVDIIRYHSRRSLLWRCVSAFQFADVLSATNPVTLLSIPLRDILFWEREGKLKRRTESASLLPILKLTLDSDGISKVERLPGPPTFTGECRTSSAFIVQHEASMSKVMAHLKDGRLRLDVPAGEPAPQIWNTPAPPAADQLWAYPADPDLCRAFYAVAMDSIRGITFFFSEGTLRAIHIHTSHQSCAMDTFERTFSGRRRWSMIWVYLPIEKCDRVVVLGIREGSHAWEQSILVRTERIGDVIVGQQANDTGKDYCLAASAPPIGDAAYASCAPLRDVLSALVFSDQSAGFCRGILFHYRNGGSRAVGQCRLHVDPVESVVLPVQLCFRGYSHPSRIDRSTIQVVQVKFKQRLDLTME